MFYIFFVTDICVDVNKVSTPQAHELNNCGHGYGMDGNDFFSFLTKDKEEADNLRLAKELEEEKAMYSVSINYRLV